MKIPMTGVWERQDSLLLSGLGTSLVSLCWSVVQTRLLSAIAAHGGFPELLWL